MNGSGLKAATGWTAALLFSVGLGIAFFFRAQGALVFSFGVVVLGVGAIGGDRAVGTMLIAAGSFAILRLIGHLVTGVGPVRLAGTSGRERLLEVCHGRSRIGG